MEDITEAWSAGPATLHGRLPDPEAIKNTLAGDVALLDRVRYLALLAPGGEALRDGLRLLEDSPGRAELLLLLAQVFHRQHHWHEAAVLQEEALQLATTRPEEATIRHQIGHRLFNEARYRDAAAEYQWASDLYRISGSHEFAERSRHAMERCRTMLHQDPGGLRQDLVNEDAAGQGAERPSTPPQP